MIEYGAKVMREQAQNPDSRLVDRARRLAAPFVLWARDIYRHDHRRTMPRTNTRDKNQPRPSNVIGYLYNAGSSTDTSK